MISVTILTKNSSRYIEKVLSALQEFDEVAILDTGSTDNTVEIARRFPNVIVHFHTFAGFGEAHNRITALAKNDWILSLDSDEIASKDIVDEILHTELDSQCVYSFSRHNYYRGKFIKGCGWYPDTVVRLYNRSKTGFSDAYVHEKVLTEGLKVVSFKAPVLHFPYNTIDDFLSKMQLYSSLFAKDKRGKKRASLFQAISHALFSFFRCYFLKKGILLGSQGFEISAYNAITAYYKYLKLRDANEQA